MLRTVAPNDGTIMKTKHAQPRNLNVGVFEKYQSGLSRA